MGKKKLHIRGQGLVEFALILPVLLLLVVGIMELSRILIIYVNLSNASREGTRYGIVNPSDYSGINTHVRDQLVLTGEEDVNITVRYDTGPNGVEFVDPQYVSVGDRVIVEVQYNVRALTGVLDPFISDTMVVNVRNARTIQSVKLPLAGTPMQAPTATYAPGVTPSTATPQPTSPPEPGSTPASTATPGATVTATPTPTPTALPPVRLNKPIWAGATSVSGSGAANQPITLRVIQLGLEKAGSIGSDGTFTISGLPTLAAGYTVVVQGYGTQDMAVVQTQPTATPLPTPTPSTAYIVLQPACLNGSGGSTNITVKGYNWPSGASNKIDIVELVWDIDSKGTFNYDGSGTFQTILFNIAVTPGTHTVRANGIRSSKGTIEATATATFVQPCSDPTPTPTATPQSLPDLRIKSVALSSTPPLGTYSKLKLAVNVENMGAVDVTSAFWVDLYADPTPGVPLEQQTSVDYVAINALSAGSTLSFTMYVPNGFTTVGQHQVVALADTWAQIPETNETNNQSAPQVITITVSNPAPTPTPTPVTPPGNPGAIQGTTRLNSIQQSNVSVYVYDVDGRLRGSGRSNASGSYTINNLPAGTYTVVGELRLNNSIYRAQVLANVAAGQMTIGVDLNLVEVAP